MVEVSKFKIGLKGCIHSRKKDNYSFMQSQTQEILTRFADSWIVTEQLFVELIGRNTAFERLKPALQFVRDLKERGEDEFFRLGASMDRLIISRSVDHGLRPDQKLSG